MHLHVWFFYGSQILLAFISVALQLPFLLNLKSLQQHFACMLILIYSLKMIALIVKIFGYIWCLLLLLPNITILPFIKCLVLNRQRWGKSLVCHLLLLLNTTFIEVTISILQANKLRLRTFHMINIREIDNKWHNQYLESSGSDLKFIYFPGYLFYLSN